MIARILVRPFGTIWKLKVLCNNRSSGLLNKLHRFIYNLYQFEHGSAISYKTKFDGVPNLPHGIKQIIITEDAKIGKNCVLFQQVTIESDTLPDSKTFGSPIIGDNCYIYPGAKIIGNITIGNNVRIGANCVVTEDLPDNTFVEAGMNIITTSSKILDNRYFALSINGWVYFDNNRLQPVNDKKIVQKLVKTFS